MSLPPGRPAGEILVAADVRIEAGDWPAEQLLARLVDAAVAASVAASRPDLVPGAEVSVLFTNDAGVRRLNDRYRGKDTATNVLSFPAPTAAGRFGPPLGDIVLACETVFREAETARVAFQAHLTHLIVHGFLHLLGYDHLTDSDAAVMEGLEAAILSKLGIADPYAGEQASGEMSRGRPPTR